MKDDLVLRIYLWLRWKLCQGPPLQPFRRAGCSRRIQRREHWISNTGRNGGCCKSQRYPCKREGLASMQIEKGFTDNWLQPTGAQELLMRQYAGCKRFVWNRALSIEQARYCRGEKMVGCTQMMRELTMWRNNPDPHSNFLREAPVHALQSVLWELYESYDKFFNKEQVHPPQFKKKARARLSFTESDPAAFELDQPNKRVRLPKLGWVKCRWTQKIAGFCRCSARSILPTRFIQPRRSSLATSALFAESLSPTVSSFHQSMSPGRRSVKRFTNGGSETNGSSARTGRRLPVLPACHPENASPERPDASAAKVEWTPAGSLDALSADNSKGNGHARPESSPRPDIGSRAGLSETDRP